MLILIVIFLIVSILIWLQIAYRIRRRLAALRAAAQTIAAGNYGHRIALGGTGEFAALATAINNIMDSLQNAQTALAQERANLKGSEIKLQLAAGVFTHTWEGISITDTSGTIIEVNNAFTRITGYSRDEVIGKNQRILSSGRQGKAFYTAMWHDLISSGHWEGEIWNRRKDGELYAQMLTISAVRNAQGVNERYIALFSDITDRRLWADKVHQLAFYDPLTQLPNRRLAMDRLNQLMALNSRNKQCGALIFLDLDNFKPLNDTHGHNAGDLLLIEVGARLHSCVRQIDTVARFGGDEFVVLLSELNADHDEAILQSSNVAEKIRGRLAEPYLLSIKPHDQADTTLEHHCTASIGVTIFADDEKAPEDIITRADSAMYQAKEGGRNRVQLYTGTGGG